MLLGFNCNPIRNLRVFSPKFTGGKIVFYGGVVEMVSVEKEKTRSGESFV
jgi:hypothetical protein